MGNARLITRNTTKSLARVLNCLPEDTIITSITEIPEVGLDIRMSHESFPINDNLSYSGFIMEKDENGNNVDGTGKLHINMNGFEIKEK